MKSCPSSDQVGDKDRQVGQMGTSPRRLTACGASPLGSSPGSDEHFDPVASCGWTLCKEVPASTREHGQPNDRFDVDDSEGGEWFGGYSRQRRRNGKPARGRPRLSGGRRLLGKWRRTLEPLKSSPRGVLLTAGLDGTVRVWSPLETPVPGAVLESAPAYTHPLEDEDAENSLPGAVMRPAQARKRSVTFGGILAMCGTTDSAGRPVLATAHNDENCIRLFELPTFADRGVIKEQREVRAVAFAPGGLIIAGNWYGDLRIWRWREQGALTSGAGAMQ